MTKIFFCADIHDCAFDLVKWFDIADVFVVCGDFGVYANFPKPVFFIIGNHENWKIISKLDAGEVKYDNCFKMYPGVKYTLSCGLTIAGIGGNFAPSRFNLERSSNHHMFMGERMRHYTFEDFDKMKKLKDIDVLVTHETVTKLCLLDRTKTFNVGRKEIDELLTILRPKYFFSGHHHKRKEIFINELNTKCISLPYAKNGGQMLEYDETISKIEDYEVNIDNEKILNSK